MPTISAADLATLRDQRIHQANVKWYVAVAPYGDPVFTARVDDPGGTIDDPNMTIPYDTGVGSVEAGMTLWIGSTARARDVGVIRVRADAAAAAGNLDVAENYDIEWADDLYITAPGEGGFRQLWSKYQLLLDDGTVKKDYDISYGSAGATNDPGENIPPKANAGPPVCVWLNDAGYVDVDFIAEDSYCVGAGETKDTYTWDFKDGAVQSWGAADPVSGAVHMGTTADPNVVRFTLTGFRYIELQVESSNGETGTVYVPMWVFDKGVVDPILALSVSAQDGQVDSGWTATISVRETDDDTVYDFPEEALVVLFTETEYGGTPTSVGGYHDRENIRMVGWIADESFTFDYERGTVEFQIQSHDQRLRRLFGLGFTVEESSSPDEWHEIKNLDVDRAVQWHHEWHTTVNEVCHVQCAGEGSTRSFHRWICAETDLFSQLQSELVDDANYFFLSDRQGILRITQNQQYIATGSRDAAICSLIQSDWRNEITAPRRPLQAGYTKIGGFAGEVAYLSWAPGNAPKQAPQEITQEGFIVQDQDELNEWSGFMLANKNNPHPEVHIELYGYWPVFDPAFQEFIELTADDPLDRHDWSAERFIVRGVSFFDMPEAGTTVTELTLEMETSGPPGVTREIPDIPEPEVPNTPLPPGPPPTPGWPEGVGMALGWDDTNVGWTDGLLPTSGADWGGAGPHWIDVTGTLSGETIIWVLYVQTGADTVGAWALTDQGAYWCDDVLTSSITWTSKLTLAAMRTLTGYGGATFRGMHAYCADPTFLIITIDPGVGNKNCGYWWNSAVYTNDTGGNWNVSSCRNVNRVPYMSLDVDENNGDIYMIGACGIMVTDYILCKSTDGGATFPQIENLSGACDLYQVGWNFMVTPLMASGTLYGTCRNGTWVFDGVSETDITPGGKTTDEEWGGIECWTFDANKVWAVFDSDELWASTDGGSNWNQLVGLLGAGNLCKPGGWPGDENVIWVVRHDVGGGGIFMQYSPDDGVNWYDLTGDWETEIANWQGGEQGSLLPLPRVGPNAP